MQLRRESSFEKKYNVFTAELKDEILSGRMKEGDFLLPENALSKKYDISRVSIRKGLAELVENGYIEKIPGKGNKVVFSATAHVTEIKLAWFSSSYELESVRKILKAFHKEHPYIRVTFDVLPEAEYVSQISHNIKQNSGPDLFMVSDSQFREMKEDGSLEHLEAYQSANLTEENSYRKVFELFSHQGAAYAVPFIFSPVVICYNKRILRQAGIQELSELKNWEELLFAAKKMTKVSEDGTVEHYGFCFSSSYHRWPVFVLQNNGKLMASNRSRSAVADPEARAALEFCTDLMYKHRVSPIFAHGSDHLAEDIFKKGKAGMILTTYYYLNEFRDMDLEWDIMPAPAEERKAALLIGGGLAINKNTPHRGAVQSLVDYMVSEKAQSIVKQNGCTIPVLRKAAEDDSLLKKDLHPAQYKTFLKVLPYAQPVGDLNLTSKEAKMLQSELNLLWANMETPHEACMRIEKILNKMLAES
ncbi:extracellular solute-binding protein [Metabacillus sp. GX 13764]|uniref:extracellular solute-binding protein n=1 Tax=Metabacillus kandeliae TaxID=2900151 RepID=UPI001E54ED35|nr:extracellular solute-binding protein [Metabacillus kandeliae]MCD7032964.1 extracellular solute-binding protein [Metabacillus kandeliae]